jgi:hypothetical protein
MYDPRYGETVTFGDRKTGPKTGKVTQINAKTVKVDHPDDPDRYWRVPPRLIVHPETTWDDHLEELEAGQAPTWKRGDTVAFSKGSRFDGFTGIVESVGSKNTKVRIENYRGSPALVNASNTYLTKE